MNIDDSLEMMLVYAVVHEAHMERLNTRIICLMQERDPDMEEERKYRIAFYSKRLEDAKEMREFWIRKIAKKYGIPIEEVNMRVRSAYEDFKTRLCEEVEDVTMTQDGDMPHETSRTECGATD